MSAQKRVATTAIDWAKFALAVPKEEVPSFNALKGRNDQYRVRLSSLPGELPKIDFASFKRAVPSMAGTIDEFASKYAAVKVDYPNAQDKLAAIDAQSKTEATVAAEWIQKSKERVTEARKALKQWDIIPPFEQMSYQEWDLYFPGLFRNLKTHHYFACENFLFDSVNTPNYYYYYGNYRCKTIPE